MATLHWWSGITWDTKIRDIGWTYIVLGVLLIFLATLFISWRHNKW